MSGHIPSKYFIKGAYGVPQEASAEFVVLGSSVDTTKLLDNLVLVSEGRDADRLEVTTAEQAAVFGQDLIGAGADVTRRTAQRCEGHTWVTVNSAKGEKRRGRWIRVRLSWRAQPNDALSPNATPRTLPQDAGRLLKASIIVRDSFV